MSDDEESREDNEDFKRWSKAVKVRDNFECQICGRRGVYLESHHLNAWKSYPEQRMDLSNGITLCSRCHQQFHECYNCGDNTKWQFEQFKKVAKTMFKLLVDKEKAGKVSLYENLEEEE